MSSDVRRRGGGGGPDSSWTGEDNWAEARLDDGEAISVEDLRAGGCGARSSTSSADRGEDTESRVPLRAGGGGVCCSSATEGGKILVECWTELRRDAELSTDVLRGGEAGAVGSSSSSLSGGGETRADTGVEDKSTDDLRGGGGGGASSVLSSVGDGEISSGLET